MLAFNVYGKHNKVIGSIKRKYFSIGDKYVLDIKDEANKEIVLAIIVAIANDINRSQSSLSND